MGRNRARVVSVKLPERLIDGIDQLVKGGLYTSRSDAIRTAVRDLLTKELSIPSSTNRARLAQQDGGRDGG